MVQDNNIKEDVYSSFTYRNWPLELNYQAQHICRETGRWTEKSQVKNGRVTRWSEPEYQLKEHV